MAIRYFGPRHTEVDGFLKRLKAASSDEMWRFTQAYQALDHSAEARTLLNLTRASGRNAFRTRARAYVYDAVRALAIRHRHDNLHYSKLAQNPQYAQLIEAARETACYLVVADLRDSHIAVKLNILPRDAGRIRNLYSGPLVAAFGGYSSKTYSA